MQIDQPINLQIMNTKHDAVPKKQATLMTKKTVVQKDKFIKHKDEGESFHVKLVLEAIRCKNVQISQQITLQFLRGTLKSQEMVYEFE